MDINNCTTGVFECEEQMNGVQGDKKIGDWRKTEKIQHMQKARIQNISTTEVEFVADKSDC